MRVLAVVASLALIVVGCAEDVPRDRLVERAPSVDDATPADGPALGDQDSEDGAAQAGGTAPSSGGEPLPVIRWSPCDSGFECGQLSVPRDYQKPGDGTISIYVKRRRARGARLGSLLVNPGGPGASAVDFVAGFARRGGALLDRFDLVGFDPRGVGRSTPLDCHATLQSYVATDPSPDDDAEWNAIDRASKVFADQCAAKHAALLPHLGTPNVARDMDRVRAALGDDKLNYLGFSYGTALGAWYAELFPQRVRAMVLDGALDLSLSAVELAYEQGKGFDAALASYFAWCGAAPRNCTWTAGSPPAEAYARLEAEVERRPLPARSADRPAGPGELALGVVAPLYGGQPGWTMLSRALAAAVGGDGSALVVLCDNYLSRRQDGSYANIIEVNQAVNCLDHPVPDLAALRGEAERFRAGAPRFGLSSLTGLFICAHWPVSQPEPPAPSARSAPPILVIGTTGDPATPYAWAEAMSEQLASAVLLTLEGEGHTAYGRGATCIDRAVDAYFLSGTVPADGTRCGSSRLQALEANAPAALFRWQPGSR